jgi:hypothetical protein
LRLKGEEKGIKCQLVKMDIRNEVHFLAHVDRTPSFLVYSKKDNAFFDLNLDFS